MPIEVPANDQTLVERDGTTWTIHTEVGTSGPMAYNKPHVLLRDGVEVARVSSGGFVQSNPDMAGDTDWRYYLEQGEFRAESTETRIEGGRGKAEKHTTTKAVFRWGGKGLAPVH